MLYYFLNTIDSLSLWRHLDLSYYCFLNFILLIVGNNSKINIIFRYLKLPFYGPIKTISFFCQTKILFFHHYNDIAAISMAVYCIVFKILNEVITIRLD